MLELQNPNERVRARKGLFRRRDARRARTKRSEKKFLSLMLVPSYSSGKTRSIRIPYSAFYILFAVIAVTGAVILGLHFRSQYLMQIAQYTAENLEQVQEAYISLQEVSEQERRLRAEERVNLQSELMRERLRGQELQEYQEQSYMESLEALQNYVEGLEGQLTQFEIYRQEILDLLSSSAHIPPVRNMLNEMYLTQMSLQDDLMNLHYYAEARRMRNQLSDDENLALLSGYQGEVPSFADEILSHIALVELTIQTKAELYYQLEEGVRRVAPYIRNYPTRRPVTGTFSSGFGWRGNAMHRGVDISAPSGTSIRATGGGTVVFSGWSGAYGNKVIVDHGIGIRTLYAHNSSNLVSVGQQVSRGDVIARVGSTGQSTGPHVHYEVIVNGSHVNPTGFFLE